MPLTDLNQPLQARRGAADRLGPSSPYTLPFKNSSGEEVPAFGVMLPTGISSSDGEWFYTIRKPGFNNQFARRWLVNGPWPVPANGYGMAADGSTPCIALRKNGAGGSYEKGLGPEHGTWKLMNGGAGNFYVLDNSAIPSGTTDQRVLVMQDSCDILSVKPTGVINFGSGFSAAADIYAGDADPFALDSGYNLPLIYETRVGTSLSVPSGTKCHVAWVAGKWVIIDGAWSVDVSGSRYTVDVGTA